LNYPVDQLNARLLKSVRMGLDEQLHTLLKVADEDAESPFRGKLAWETNTDADQWVAPSAIEQSFRIIRAADRKDLDEDTWIDFYLTVWIAVHEEWGDIWQDPRTEPDAAGREYRLLQKVGIITLFTFLCERLFAKADDLDSPLNLGDLESVKDFVRRTLQGLDPHFFSAKWKLGEFDTRQGRDRILRALRMIPQYKRANVDWREEIDFIDEPEAQRPRAP